MALIVPEFEHVVHRLEYATDVITNWSSLENRIALLNAPRESWDLELFPTSDQVQELRRELFQDAVSAWTLPLHYEAVIAQAAITGTTVIVNATYSDWAVIGTTVFVSNGGGNYYTATIDNATGALATRTLTLSASPSSGTYAAGVAFVCPVASVLLPDAGALLRYWEESGRWRVRCDASTFGATFGTGTAAFSTHAGYDILTERPIIVDMNEETFRTGMSRFDYGAIRQQEWSYTVANIQRTHLFNGQGAADRQFWKSWLHARKGKQKAFLLPTWRDDLVLTTNPPSGTSLVVRNTENYVSHWFPSLAHRYLRLEQADGGVEYKTVTAAVDSGGGNQTLTINSAVSGESIVKISFMELCRQTADATELVYSTGLNFQLQYASTVVQR